jgi:hypothetical protein
MDIKDILTQYQEEMGIALSDLVSIELHEDAFLNISQHFSNDVSHEEIFILITEACEQAIIELYPTCHELASKILHKKRPCPMSFLEWMIREYPNKAASKEDGEWPVDDVSAEWFWLSYQEAVKHDLKKWQFWMTGK